MNLFSQQAQGQAAPDVNTQGYIALSDIWPDLRPYLLASGTRIRKPGKERITASGTVTVTGDTARTVNLVLEFPKKLRLTDSSSNIIQADLTDSNAKLPSQKRDNDVLETLLEDSFEGVIDSHIKGTTRFFTGYRRAASKTSKAPSPLFDIVQVWTPSKFHGNQKSTIKQFWFDKRTRTLSRVVYSTQETGLVEIVWGDWRSVQGEMLPFSIERLEGGKRTLLLTLSSAVVTAKAEDGIFKGNGK